MKARVKLTTSSGDISNDTQKDAQHYFIFRTGPSFDFGASVFDPPQAGIHRYLRKTSIDFLENFLLCDTEMQENCFQVEIPYVIPKVSG